MLKRFATLVHGESAKEGYRIDKTRFAEYVYQNGSEVDFRHFAGLREVVRRILSAGE